MPIHRERRVIPCAPEFFFDIVADVECYPEYLSFWQDARIYRRDSDVYYTVQQIGIGPARETFRTRTDLSRPSRIRVTSTDDLFREFETLWLFEPVLESSCQVDFIFKCEAASFIMRRVMDVMLDEVARNMVKAFEERALSRYEVEERRKV